MKSYSVQLCHKFCNQTRKFKFHGSYTAMFRDATTLVYDAPMGLICSSESA